MSDLQTILMRRDGMNAGEARDVIADIRLRVSEGEDPEELLHDELGLEPDYLFDLL